MIDSFLAHYQHNADLAPDKSSLRDLTLNKNEKFCMFAQRWRNLAAQITPPMNKSELVDEFMALTCLANNIKTACATLLTFSQLVKAGVRVEASQGNVFKPFEENSKGKKEEKEVHKISEKNSFDQSIYRAPGQHNKPRQSNNQYQHHQQRNSQQHQQPQPPLYQQQQQSQQPQPSQQQVYRNPLPFSQAYLFKQCLAEGMITPIPTRQYLPPYPKWYDTNAYCEFHEGVQGHSTENCYSLRRKLYELIEVGELKITNLETT